MTDVEEKVIKVGTRKSQLAQIQTKEVVEHLKKLYPTIKFEIVPMSTTGDKILDVALSKIGEKALFTKELEDALDRGDIDFIVHSLKDLPTTLPKGLVIGAICVREDPVDAVVMHEKYKENTLGSLPDQSVVGTSSLRRTAQLRRKFPHLKFQDVRGNLNTRFRKLDEGDTYSALILAKAGIVRMGWKSRISQELGPEECMYAVGQGALAVECREDTKPIIDLLSKLHDKETVLRCVAERAFMKTLEGGCSVPVAVDSKYVNNELHLSGGVFSLDGSTALTDQMSTNCEKNDVDSPSPKRKKLKTGIFKTYSSIVAENIPQALLENAEQLGIDLAKKLQEGGATEILSQARKDNSVKNGSSC